MIPDSVLEAACHLADDEGRTVYIQLTTSGWEVGADKTGHPIHPKFTCSFCGTAVLHMGVSKLPPTFGTQDQCLDCWGELHGEPS